ncbi:MAG TPA: ABC transporter substrate-binding protein [Anaeromyxobacter sp.]|nr:ABC transporter substrate-binding protein [Anaeromyxobacter sp.]
MKRLLLACLTASVLAACTRPPPRRIAVATVRQPATSLLFVALQAGCFDREGLAIDERPFELGRDALALLRDRAVDLAIAYETPFLVAAREEPALRILTSLHSSTQNTRLVARRSAGVDDFADLAGKRIGIAQGTNAEFFMDVALRYGGVRREAVAIVPLAPEDAAARLRDGTLDAAVLSDPPASHAEQALGDEAVVVRTELYAEFSVLVARAETIERRRPELEATLRALSCGERLARAAPEKALALIGGRFPELSEPELRAQVAHVTWGLNVDQLLAQVLRRESEWLHARAPAVPIVPTSQLLAPGPLEAVDPEAVMLLPAPAR